MAGKMTIYKLVVLGDGGVGKVCQAASLPPCELVPCCGWRCFVAMFIRELVYGRMATFILVYVGVMANDMA